MTITINPLASKPCGVTQQSMGRGDEGVGVGGGVGKFYQGLKPATSLMPTSAPHTLCDAVFITCTHAVIDVIYA